MVDCKPSNPCREAFVKPEFIPPIHGDEVTKPLMGEFYGSISLVTVRPELYTKLRLTVRNNIGDAIFIPSIRFTLVK